MTQKVAVCGEEPYLRCQTKKKSPLARPAHFHRSHRCFRGENLSTFSSKTSKRRGLICKNQACGRRTMRRAGPPGKGSKGAAKAVQRQRTVASGHASPRSMPTTASAWFLYELLNLDQRGVTAIGLAKHLTRRLGTVRWFVLNFSTSSSSPS